MLTGKMHNKHVRIGAETIFRLGEQKLVKNNQDNQIQSITFCKKGKRSVQWGLGQNRKSWRIFENFSVKRLLLTVRYRKN